MLPPRAVRRIVVAPAVFIGGVVFVVLSPVLIMVAALFDLFDRRGWRGVRMTVLGLVYAAYETLGLVALALLWISSGFGVYIRTQPFRRAHVAVARWWLDGVSRAMLSLLGLRISYERQPRGTGPVLVFSRHAGPGDSVLLARTLLVDYQRQPRIIARRELQWAPFIDVVCNRLPNHFVDPDPEDGTFERDAIRQLAAGLGGREAMLLFPEGGNFTVRRRDRAITSLERSGHWDRATKAAHMHNLVAPRPGGAMSAMAGAPDADVVFVAHSGLEDLDSLAIIWQRMPLDRTVKASYWRVSPDERPSAFQLQVDWLYAWWSRIDRWIEANRPEGVTPAPKS